jgi:hypothetical protein
VKVCIFTGPTLAPRDGAEVLEANWLPPAKHGDVYRVVSLLRPRAIGIVDGYFQWVPSVWHKEILWALAQGVHVFGAASMGALRAAELASFGMRGVGHIFEAYRDGVLEDDDEVAVIHGPPENGYLAASDAMVNIRYTLAAAQHAGVIDLDTHDRMVALAKAAFFPERSYERLLGDARAAGLPGAALATLEAWLPAGRVNQKRADALAMLAMMRDFVAAGAAPARTGFSFEHTTLWDRAVGELQPATVHDADEAEVLDELRLDGARFDRLRRDVLSSLVAAPRVGATALDDLARQEALRGMADDIPAPIIERQMLSRLRATGEYASLLARALDKRKRLGDRSDLPKADDFSELQLLELRDWYFSLQPAGDMPNDLERYLRDSGYPDEMRFHQAIFAEYVYRNAR